MNLENVLDRLNRGEDLVEGGGGGHMAHPYDKYRTPEEILDFFNKFLSGEFGGTEKVDGYNLFAGFDKQGKVVAVRNKNHPPIENITSKFGLTHGAFEGFTAGWKAIKSGLERLSKSDRVKYSLVEQDGTPLNFINLEILFGYIPNVVPYSKTKNFIVFHTLAGSHENNWNSPETEDEKKLLKQLADKIGSVSVKSSAIKYEGEPGSVDRKSRPIDSYWEIKGPIKIDKEKIKSELKSIKEKWQSWPETKRLQEFAKKPVPEIGSEEYEKYDEERFKLMKAVTKKLGKETLKNMVSKLSDTGNVIAGHPGIEGIALDIEGDLVKITGDFLDFNKPEEIPTIDATKDIREEVQKNILGMNVKTLGALKTKTKGGLVDFVFDRRKKNYVFEEDTPVDSKIKSQLKSMIKSAQKDIKDALKLVKGKGRAFDEKSLLVQSFVLSSFEKSLDSVNTYRDLIEAYGESFFNIKG